jgi:hypothetical protein
MSFSFDTFEQAWARLRSQLPPETRDGELAVRFELMLSELHEANHRLGDAVNKDARVTRHACRLSEAMHEHPQAPKGGS